MRPAVLGTSQLYYLFDETLVISLRLFTCGFSKRVLLKKTQAFCVFFPESFSSEVDFFKSSCHKEKTISSGSPEAVTTDRLELSTFALLA